MLFQFSDKRALVTAALLLGSSVSAFAESTTNSATPGKTGGYDFTVVSINKDQTHPQHSEGSKIGFSVNGVQGRTLILVRGKTYTFNVDTGVQHDFYLSTVPMGWGAGTLTAGVEGNFTYKGVVTFKPTTETPDLVYYQCRNHKYMGGTIHVVNPGEEDKIKLPEPVATAPVVQQNVPTVDKAEVKQKLDFADISISKSEAAKRITASNDVEAKEKYKGAQDRLAAARSAFDSGNLPEAKTKVDEAMGLMTEATRRVPSKSIQDEAKARYRELAQGIATLEASYKQNYEAIVSEDGAKNIQKLDSEKLRQKLDSAKTLSEEGKYDKANEILSNAQDEISSVLNKMLANRNMSYEMKFSTPAQEYAYELARFAHFEELIPNAVELQRPPQTTLTMMETYVNKGKEKRDQAIADAKQQNFAAAVENIKSGTERLEQALKLLGVR